MGIFRNLHNERSVPICVCAQVCPVCVCVWLSEIATAQHRANKNQIKQKTLLTLFQKMLCRD